MKMRDWEQKLAQLRDGYGKQFFRVSELANLATNNPEFIGGELARLLKAGVLVRYATGVYGLPGAGDIPQLAKTIDSSAYVTGADALYHHGLITQAAVGKTCFTNRRHNRSRVRRTPLGTFAFICTSPPVYSRPKESGYATPAQALHDFVFISRLRGADPEAVATFRNLGGVDKADMENVGQRYPETVRLQARSVWASASTASRATAASARQARQIP
jgi:hypothetical protein